MRRAVLAAAVLIALGLSAAARADTCDFASGQCTQTVTMGGGPAVDPVTQIVTMGAGVAVDRFRGCKARHRRPWICRHGLRGGLAPDRWLAIAAAYWGVTATCPPSTVRLIWDQDLLDNTSVGRAFGMAYIGACWIDGAPRAIWLNPYFRPDTRNYPDAFWCRVVTHEYGHLIGLYHSTDPTSIMGPNLPNVPVAGC